MKIKPIRIICKCGNKVIHHHFFCDECYSEIKKLERRLADLVRRKGKNITKKENINLKSKYWRCKLLLEKYK